MPIFSTSSSVTAGPAMRPLAVTGAVVSLIVKVPHC
jgi:hypothetical protein